MTSRRVPAGRDRPTGDRAAFRRVLGCIGVVELWLAGAAFAAVVCLTIVQVTLRYVFEGSLWWAQEVSQMLILVAYFQGISYVFKTRQYIVVQFLTDRLPVRAQLGCYLLAQTLIVFFCGVVVVEGIMIVPRQYVMLTYILHIPRFYLGLPLLIASLSIIVTAVYYALAAWREAARRPGADLTELERGILLNEPVGEL